MVYYLISEDKELDIHKNIDVSIHTREIKIPFGVGIPFYEKYRSVYLHNFYIMSAFASKDTTAKLDEFLKEKDFMYSLTSNPLFIPKLHKGFMYFTTKKIFMIFKSVVSSNKDVDMLYKVCNIETVRIFKDLFPQLEELQREIDCLIYGISIGRFKKRKCSFIFKNKLLVRKIGDKFYIYARIKDKVSRLIKDPRCSICKGEALKLEIIDIK